VRAGQVGQRDVQPPGRLEEHLGARVLGQLGEPRVPLARLARREALEAEPVAGQPGDGERGRERGRAGDGGNPDSGGRGGGGDPVAGVADPGHPGIRHDEDVLAGLQLGDELPGPVRLDLVVIGHDAAGNRHVQVIGQPPGAAGVLSGHDVSAGQFSGQPGGRVLRPANRHGRENQRADSVSGLITFRAVSDPHWGFPPHTMAFDDRDEGRRAGHGPRRRRP